MSLFGSEIEFIAEVKKRPFLYINNNPEDFDKSELCLKLWTEVCEKTVLTWNEMSPPEQILRRKEVVARWAYLSYCFWEDYDFQRKEIQKRTPNRKRPWLYFNQLSFLLTQEQKELINYNDNDQSDDTNIEERITKELMESSRIILEPDRRGRRTQSIGVMTLNEQRDRLNTIELINQIQGNLTRNEEYDEEKMFLLSLLPIMKKLNDEQKYIAKIEILNLLRRTQLLPST